ncbi:MAG TPA: phosphoribosyltransferase family protein [Terriglobia bacterium]|nr:phosphoribosyltransferase family protein [Terriglobia bacterium]
MELKTAFSEQRIQERIQALGKEISRDYGAETIHVIAMMENSFIFMADLVRKITSPVICHFLKTEMVDSQEAGHQPVRRITYQSLGDVEGKNLLVVQTLVDSGVPLEHLLQQLSVKKPKSLRTAALVNREDHRRVPLTLAYVGFAWDGGHLVGYGLDQTGLYRNLPYLAEVNSRGPQ